MSASTLMQITGVSGKQYKKVRWHDRDLVVRQLLPIDEFIDLVQRILRDCLSPENELVPELIDFAIRKNIVATYAFIDLPANADQLYYTLYASDVFVTVLGIANESQVEAAIRAVMMYVNSVKR